MRLIFLPFAWFWNALVWFVRTLPLLFMFLALGVAPIVFFINLNVYVVDFLFEQGDFRREIHLASFAVGFAALWARFVAPRLLFWENLEPEIHYSTVYQVKSAKPSE